MQRHEDGSVTLTQGEVRSLKKMIVACSDMLSQLPSYGGDLMGQDNYYAMQMWEDKIQMRTSPLDYYIDDEEEKPSHKKKPQTVDAWLEAYGKKK